MPVFVGIDVAKRNHTGVVLDAQGQVLQPPFSISNDRAGIQQLLDRLSGLADDVELGVHPHISCS